MRIFLINIFLVFCEFGDYETFACSFAAAASRSRAWSLAIGRSGVGCHCEKADLPTLAAQARRALPLVGTAWCVTARKENHNASNARGVTAGKMVCVSVKYRRPNRWTDQDQIWHAYADGPGDGSYLNKCDPHPRRGRSGNFRESKKSKAREMS